MRPTRINNNPFPNIQGDIIFKESTYRTWGGRKFSFVSEIRRSVEVIGKITGMKNGTYGMHVHTYGHVGSNSANATGSHFNPLNTTHGCIPNLSRHVGDLGNFDVRKVGNVQNVGRVSFIDDFRSGNLLRVEGDQDLSIVGRALVIHSMRDDCVSNPAGNSGTRVGECVIGWTTEASALSVLQDM